MGRGPWDGGRALGGGWQRTGGFKTQPGAPSAWVVLQTAQAHAGVSFTGSAVHGQRAEAGGTEGGSARPGPLGTRRGGDTRGHVRRDMPWAAGRMCVRATALGAGGSAPPARGLRLAQRPGPEEDSKPHCLGFSPLVTHQAGQPWASFGLCAKHLYAHRNQFLRWGGDNYSGSQVSPAPIISRCLQRQQWMLGCPEWGTHLPPPRVRQWQLAGGSPPTSCAASVNHHVG